MGLIAFVLQLALGVAVMVAIAAALFIDRKRLVETARHPHNRLREIAPHIVLIVLVLLLNRAFRHLGQEISWLIGWNITGLIYALEGDLVASIQTVATPALTAFFSFIYLHGYVFLTVFPLLAYVVLEDVEPSRKLLIAYSMNYALGLALYTTFIAYGPRNLFPDTVEGLLYSTYPQSQLLTSTVNANTNAFPSLHTSLSVTVMLLAYRTRDRYPGWFGLSIPLTLAILLSTLYLGIHWASDLLGGLLVAIVSVRVADRYHELPALSAMLSTLCRASLGAETGQCVRESTDLRADDRRPR